MRPSSFIVNSWTKLEVSALFQSGQHVRNMFSYKSANGNNNARPRDSKKNGNPPPPTPPQKKKKKRFLPHNVFFFSKYQKTYLFNENNTLSHIRSCKLNLHSSKRHTDMSRKGDQPFERIKMPRKFRIDNE